MVVLIAGSPTLNATAVYFVVDIAERAINLVWQVFTWLGFFLYKVYSEFVTSEQWTRKKSTRVKIDIINLRFTLVYTISIRV